MNKAQEKFLEDYSHSPISKDYSLIDYSEFWDRVLDPGQHIDLDQNDCSHNIHKATYYHDGYLYIYYSLKSKRDVLVKEDTFACKYTHEDMPVPGDFVDENMYYE